MPQYLYRTQLVRPDMALNPTPEEQAIVSEHFDYLVSLMDSGRLILAGRTQTDAPFGITILQVDSEDAAHDIMRNDPTIKKGLFSAELFPYRVALIREDNVQR
jgi:uncharacterized protein